MQERQQSEQDFGKTKNSRRNGTVERKGFKRADAATYLGVAPVTIDRLTKRGLLRPSRALRHPIYDRDDLDRFLKETAEVLDGAEP